MNDQLTIVIPTHNRPLPVKRAIDYYSRWGCRVIVCDSSLHFSKETGYENIDHLHFPGQNFSEKIFNALQLVTTPFACLCADDDFLSQDGIRRGMDFLDLNKEYVSVQGRYIQFWLAGKYIPCVPLYKPAFGNHFGEDSPEQRILSSARSGMHQLYSLHRTDILLHSFSICKDIKLPTLSEYSSNIVGMIFGKHIMLPIFWMARDRERYTEYNYTEANENTIMRRPQLRNYLLSVEGNPYKENFSKLYAKITGLGISDGNQLFDKVFFEIYLPDVNVSTSEVVVKPRLVQKPGGFGNLIKSAIPSRLPGKIRSFMKSLIPKKLIDWRNSKLYPFPFMEEPAFSIDWEGMKKIITSHGNLNPPEKIV